MDHAMKLNLDSPACGEDGSVRFKDTGERAAEAGSHHQAWGVDIFREPLCPALKSFLIMPDAGTGSLLGEVSSRGQNAFLEIPAVGKSIRSEKKTSEGGGLPTAASRGEILESINKP